VWPAALSYEERHEALQEFCRRLARAWADFDRPGHPVEVGHAFQAEVLPGDVGRSILGPYATEEQVQLLNQKLGADRPLVVRYASWAGNFVTGDWGESALQKVPVRPLVLKAFGNSLILAGFGVAANRGVRTPASKRPVSTAAADATRPPPAAAPSATDSTTTTDRRSAGPFERSDTADASGR